MRVCLLICSFLLALLFGLPGIIGPVEAQTGCVDGEQRCRGQEIDVCFCGATSCGWRRAGTCSSSYYCSGGSCLPRATPVPTVPGSTPPPGGTPTPPPTGGGPGCSLRGGSCGTPAGCCGTMSCDISGNCAGCNTDSNNQADCQAGGGSWGDPGIKCFDSGSIGAGVYCGGAYNSTCYMNTDQVSCQRDGCLWDEDPTWAGRFTATCSVCSCRSVIIPPTVPPPPPPNFTISNVQILNLDDPSLSPNGAPGSSGRAVVTLQNSGGSISSGTQIWVSFEKQKGQDLQCGQGVGGSKSYNGHNSGSPRQVTFDFVYPNAVGTKTARFMVDSTTNVPAGCKIAETNENDNVNRATYDVLNLPPVGGSDDYFEAYGGNVVAANPGYKVNNPFLAANKFISANISGQAFSAGFIAGETIDVGSGKYSQQNGAASSGWNLNGLTTSNSLTVSIAYDQYLDNLIRYSGVNASDPCGKNNTVDGVGIRIYCYNTLNFSQKVNEALNNPQAEIKVVMPRTDIPLTDFSIPLDLDISQPVSNEHLVVFVPTKINILRNFVVNSTTGSTATFVTNSGVELTNPDTTSIVDGFYIIGGEFRTRKGGGATAIPVSGHGSILALGEGANISFNRSVPAAGVVSESWFYEPKYFPILTKTMTKPPTSWRELSPQ